jgi:hypothetical protein
MRAESPTFSEAYNQSVNLFGKSEITTTEISGELRFVVVQPRAWVAPAVGAVITSLFIWQAWRSHSLVIAVCSLIALASLAGTLLRGKETVLSVNSEELVSRGNIGKAFSREVRVPASEVISLGYDTGGEDDPTGLYVRKSWGRTCLIPGIDESEATRIATAINSRFPEIEKSDPTPASFLFGNDGGLTTLGLS